MLAINDLTISYISRKGNLTALKRCSFDVKEGSIVGLVGESGAGKSTVVNSVMQILPHNSQRSGSIRFNGTELNKQTMSFLRGKDISFISQNFHQSLSNNFKIKNQFDYLLKSNLKMSKENRYKQMCFALESLNFIDPPAVLNSYPFELSGGMLQRVVIAMAISTNPKFIIADEPTSAIDIIIIHRFLDYLKMLNKERNMTILLISHDLNLIRGLCNEIIVLLEGHIVEKNNHSQIFTKPLHPYTKMLLNSKPKPKMNLLQEKKVLRDEKDSPCPFYQYCDEVNEKCETQIKESNNKEKRYQGCNLVDKRP